MEGYLVDVSDGRHFDNWGRSIFPRPNEVEEGGYFELPSIRSNGISVRVNNLITQRPLGRFSLNFLSHFSTKVGLHGEHLGLHICIFFVSWVTSAFAIFFLSHLSYLREMLFPLSPSGTSICFPGLWPFKICFPLLPNPFRGSLMVHPLHMLKNIWDPLLLLFFILHD